jgi:hypothetical protein
MQGKFTTEVANRAVENVAKFSYMEIIATSPNLIDEEIKSSLNLGNSTIQIITFCLKTQK